MDNCQCRYRKLTRLIAYVDLVKPILEELGILAVVTLSFVGVPVVGVPFNEKITFKCILALIGFFLIDVLLKITRVHNSIALIPLTNKNADKKKALTAAVIWENEQLISLLMCFSPLAAGVWLYPLVFCATTIPMLIAVHWFILELVGVTDSDDNVNNNNNNTIVI